MELVLNQEQELLAGTAREFFAAQCPVSALRLLRDSQDPVGFDPSVWLRMAELGWTAIPFPESVGGLNCGIRSLGVLFEEAGRTLAACPLISSLVLGGLAIVLTGSAEQLRHYAPGVIAGDILLALVVGDEVQNESASVALLATPSGAGYVLNGDSSFVIDGHVANYFVVAAGTAGCRDENSGITLFIVDADAPGIDRQRIHIIDSRNAAHVRFDNVYVSPEAVLGEPDAGAGCLEEVLDCGRACISAEMLGIGQNMFDKTIAYLKDRFQFGVPIGSFQALQHRAARMFTELELTRSAVVAALDAVDSRSKDRRAIVSLAKWKVGTVLDLISREAVQMHGGIAMTDEMDIGLYLKRGRVLRNTFGGEDFHQERYAALIGLGL